MFPEKVFLAGTAFVVLSFEPFYGSFFSAITSIFPTSSLQIVLQNIIQTSTEDEKGNHGSMTIPPLVLFSIQIEVITANESFHKMKV